MEIKQSKEYQVKCGEVKLWWKINKIEPVFILNLSNLI